MQGTKNTLTFLLQQRIGAGSKITVPDEVRELLFENPEWEENQYMWNYDEVDNYIIISNESLREEQSSWEATSKAGKENPCRTKIPSDIMKKFELEEGDDLYFTTPEAVKSGLPSVFVWTFDQTEEIILRGVEKAETEFPRQPHF